MIKVAKMIYPNLEPNPRLDYKDKSQYKDITYIYKYYQLFNYLDVYYNVWPNWHYEIRNKYYQIHDTMHDFHFSIFLDMFTRYNI